MTDAAPPRVLISYSHDSAEHEARVLAFADRLRADGIDAMIDLYVQSPPEGWPAWCDTQIGQSQFVLMVCTAIYLRRVEGNEGPGIGHGVLWEGRLIKQHLYDSGSVSSKFVPALLADGSPEHIPTPVRGGTIYRVESDDGYEALLRLLTDQPLTPITPLGRRPELLPRQRQSLGEAPAGSPSENPAQPSAASLPHPRVEDLFVGRRTERDALADALFPASGRRHPVVVSGMAGVGKSYLVDRFYWENAAQFPGGYQRLAIDPDKPASAADLPGTLRDRLKVPATGDAALAARLLMPLTLVHVENADTFEAGGFVGDLAATLPHCALVVSARLRGLGADAGWREVVVAPFDSTTALEQLQAELGSAAQGQESWPALAEALGCLPLALHLAAGHLRADRRAEAFLRRLRTKNLALTGTDPADPTFRYRSRALLSDTFELSLDALHREGGTDGEPWLAGFAALAHAPVTGFGESLGAAISGAAPEIFDDLVIATARLSLLERVPRGAGIAFRLHPLLAELLRPRAHRDAAIARMTEWFLTRLPEGGDDQGRRWSEVHGEIAALTEWLAQIPPADRVRVRDAGNSYAMLSGPYHAWVRFCEAALAEETGEAHRSNLLWTQAYVAFRGGLLDRALAAAEEKRGLDRKRGAEYGAALAAGLIADILEAGGQLDEALRIRTEEELPVYERLGNERERARTQGQIADILQARGQLDEALKIRNEEQLPVYARLGDVRERAVTIGRIADILEARGQLDEALKIRNEEELPVYARLGNVRERALTMGKIADILQARGQLDEALKIRNEEELPVYERLSDVRSRAVTMGKIADILQARGQLEEALRIRNEEELPVYQRLGDVRLRAVTMGKIAQILQARGQLDEAPKIRNGEELPVYARLGDVRSQAVTKAWIANILQARGDLDGAARVLLEDVLPVYEHLGDVHELLRGRWQLAGILLQRGGEGDRGEARRLLHLALGEARRLKLPEAQQIEQLIEQAGLGEDEIAALRSQ